MATIDCPAIAAEDGYLEYRGGFGGTWANAVAASGGAFQPAGDTAASYYLAAADNAVGVFATQIVDRGFLSFDLSSVPGGVTITGAVLHVKGYDVASGAGGSLKLFDGTQGAALTTGDWTAYGSTELMTAVNFASLSGSGWNDLTLNSSGISSVQSALAGGKVQFCARSSFDTSGTGPGSSTRSYLAVRYADYSTSGDRPYLTLTYTGGAVERTGADSLSFTDQASRTAERTAADAIAFTDTAPGVPTRFGTDTIAFTDAGAPFSRSLSPITVRSAGKVTIMSGSHAGNAGTIATIGTTGFPTSGTLQVIEWPDYTEQTTITYTGISGNSFTGCSGGSSHSFPSGSIIAQPDSGNHFPAVVKTDDSVAPGLIVAYTQHGTHTGKNGAIKAKKSTDGGASWGSEFSIVAAPTLGSDYLVGVPAMLRTQAGDYLIAWYENNMRYATLDSTSCFSSMCAAADDPTDPANWTTPVAIPNFYGSDEQACGPGIFEHDGDVYLTLYGLDAGDAWTDTAAYCKLVKTGDLGANWSLVGTVATTAQTGGYQNGECAIVRFPSGRWYAMMRVENGPARWSCYSDDEGVTWTGHVEQIASIFNLCGVVLSPEGLLFSQGGDGSGYGGSEQPISYFSLDSGASFPTSQRRLESTSSPYTVFNGSDFEQVGVAYERPNLANAWAAQTSDMFQAQVYFQWFVGPPYGMDAIAFTDTAAPAITATRTAADALAFTDTADAQPVFPRVGTDTLEFTDTLDRSVAFARTGTDALEFTDTAGRDATTATRTGADTLALTDAPTRTSTRSRTGADTVTFTDTAAQSGTHSFSKTGADTLAFTDTASGSITGPASYIRTAGDTLTFTDSVTARVTGAWIAIPTSLSSVQFGASTLTSSTQTGRSTLTSTQSGASVLSSYTAGNSRLVPADHHAIS